MKSVMVGNVYSLLILHRPLPRALAVDCHVHNITAPIDNCNMFLHILQMSTNKSIRTYIRPTKEFPESVQRAGATGAEIYVESKREKLADFIQHLRRGDIAEVQWLYLLAAPRSKSNPRPAWGLKKTMKAIAEAGAVIVEWGSGKRLRSNRAGDVAEMLFRAHKMITTSGRSQAVTGRAGRPRRAFTPDQLDYMKRQWLSTRNRTNMAAVNKIREHGIKGVDANTLYRLFGPSGRAELRKSRRR